MTGHDIGDDKNFDGVVNACHGNDTLCINANRHSDKEPAATFGQGIGFANMLGLSTALPTTVAPSELNFVVYGQMHFEIDDKTYVCPDFRIGQGTEIFKHNWWISSSECYTDKLTNSMACCCGNRLCKAGTVNPLGKYAI